MTSNQFTNSFSSDADVQIVINLISQNVAANTSVVEVNGWMHNHTSSAVSNSTANTTRSITGDQSYTPGDFSFTVPANGAFEFITHEFTIHHDGAGNASCHFWVQYGDSHTSVFGSNRGANVVLDLPRIPKRPSVTGKPTFTNIGPQTVDVAWTAPSDNGGLAITTYRLSRYNGSTPSGAFVASDGNTRTRHVTGLTPGATYCFVAYAKNTASDNGGWSNPSASAPLSMKAGAYIRVNGAWALAVPYIRSGGIWKIATPYVRTGGIWKVTE
jgi:hypothetical protein